MTYPRPANETERLEALKSYKLLDTPNEQSFDDFVHLASFICTVPIALISLLDEERQWFKARIGLEATQTPREQAFCTHAILSDQTMVVEDALSDPRFAENPLVCADPYIRFYAGVPLVDVEGFALGTLCVIDRKPRQLNSDQQHALEVLARQVVTQCQLQRIGANLVTALENVKTLSSLLPICAYCKDIRNDRGYWRGVEEYISSQTEASFTHSICPTCAGKHFPDVEQDTSA